MIERNAFSNLNRLYCLDLSENMIQGIKKNTFSHLENLEVLDLSNNQLNKLESLKYIGVRNTVKIFLEILHESRMKLLKSQNSLK